MIDRGRGFPIVLIPGIQGRWEWMTPAIRALSTRHRVLSFSLHEGGAGSHPTGAFDAWMEDIDAIVRNAHVGQIAIVGVSFGGLIAARYAARRPERVASLVMVSTPAPRPKLDERSMAYLKYPRLAMPAFSLRACRRLLPEAISARARWGARLQFVAEYTARAVRSPLSPSRMAEWVRAWMAVDIATDCRGVVAPTLLVTGEPRLDRVVPVAQTLEYLNLITGARHAEFRHTGHVGLVSRPAEFADLVGTFVDEHAAASHPPGMGKAG